MGMAENLSIEGCNHKTEHGGEVATDTAGAGGLMAGLAVSPPGNKQAPTNWLRPVFGGGDCHQGNGTLFFQIFFCPLQQLRILFLKYTGISIDKFLQVFSVAIV